MAEWRQISVGRWMCSECELIVGQKYSKCPLCDTIMEEE